MIESEEDHRKRIMDIMRQAQETIQQNSIISLPAHIRTIDDFIDWLEFQPGIEIDEAHYDARQNCIMVKLVDQDLIPF